MNSCSLCQYDLNKALFVGDSFFIIDAQEKLFPGYVRIVARNHVKEWSFLSDQERQDIQEAMLIVEKTMIKTMNPEKVNWAQFGNMVPHLHWHAIPRYKDDSHFPQSIWGAEQRKVDENLLAERKEKEVVFFKSLKEALSQHFNA